MNTPPRTNFDYVAQQWHHIDVTYSKSTKIAQLWVDGVAASPDPNGPIQADLTSTPPTAIRPSQGVLPETFTGALDEIAIYSTALPGSTITDHFAAVKP